MTRHRPLATPAIIAAGIRRAEKERANANAAAVNIALEAERLQCENDALRAKIAEMEQQEPAAWIARGGYPVPLDELEWQLWYGSEKPTLSWVNQEARPLYALPGAKPAPSIPEGWKEGVESAARLIDQKAELYAIRFGHDDMGGLSFGTGAHAEIKMDHYTNLIELADEVRATLAAAPEAKP